MTKNEWITRVRELLEHLEHAGTDVDSLEYETYGNDHSCCPCCEQMSGHDPDCELKILMDAVELE